MLSFRFLVWSFSLFCLSLGSQPGGAATYVVNPASARAADSGSGTATQPFRTIGAAIDKANAGGGRILIEPGAYRETLSIPKAEGAPPLTIEASGTGDVILEGGENWNTGWKREGNSNRWSHDWPYTWGVAPNARANLGVRMDDIARRREMLFYQGAPVRQASGEWDMHEGTFSVEEGRKRIYLQTEKDAPPPDWSAVVVSVRGTLLRIAGRDNVTVRGITFQRAQTGMAAENSAHLTVEDCHFYNNNLCGLSVDHGMDMVLRRCVATGNGMLGIDISVARNLLYEGCETSYNNWRGASGNLTEWDVAGARLRYIHGGRLLRPICRHNQSVGLWLDQDCRDISVENGRMEQNSEAGMRIEATDGPISVLNSILNQNRRGIYLLSAGNITLSGNSLIDNSLSQISIYAYGGKGTAIQDWENAREYLALPVNNSISHCNLVCAKPGQVLYENHWDDRDGWKIYVTHLSANDNTYGHPTESAIFPGTNGNRITFSQWRIETGQDSRSVWGMGSPRVHAKLVSPPTDGPFEPGSDVLFKVDAKSDTSPIMRAQFYLDGNRAGEALKAPFAMHWPAVSGNHQITVAVTDLRGDVTYAPSRRLQVAFRKRPGSILREVWWGIHGVGLSDFTESPRLKELPDICEGLPAMEAPSMSREDYGQRLRGYLCPEVSGNYTFWIASDDMSNLFLSTDEQPEHKQRIAMVSGYVALHEFDRNPEQKSPVITLTAGKRYYIEVVYRQLSAVEALGVAWQGPGMSRQIISGKYLVPAVPDYLHIAAVKPGSGSKKNQR